MHMLHRAAVLAAVLSVVAGCGPRNQFVPPPPPKVTVARPLVRDVTTYGEATGVLKASEFIEIRARVRGFLVEKTFQPGDDVEAGQVLFQIERGPYEATVSAAEAELAKAEADLSLAGTTYARKQELFASSAISDLELREAKASNDGAQAAVARARASLASARIDLDYTTVTAPIAGKLSRDLVNVGNLVGGGEATLLTTLVQVDPIFAYFQLGERDLLYFLGRRVKRIEEGTDTGLVVGEDEAIPVRLRLADGSVYAHRGRVDFIDNVLNPDTGTVEVRAVFPNPNGVLSQGLFARVGFPVDHEDAVLVPRRAIQQDMSGRFVFIVENENLVVTRQVEVGAEYDAFQIVTKGLQGSDRVIIDGLQRARPGIEVECDEAAPELSQPGAP